ncbi:MAG: CGNR zinc finger domain-containing protein, partial [Gemmatimonadetes bacterium]|nr:CGNR zinc finger domain-containing protein [Gemmatimonadota bacterium]
MPAHKAGRRRWCSMRTCGGRAKVRAFYRRRALDKPNDVK